MAKLYRLSHQKSPDVEAFADRISLQNRQHRSTGRSSRRGATSADVTDVEVRALRAADAGPEDYCGRTPCCWEHPKTLAIYPVP